MRSFLQINMTSMAFFYQTSSGGSGNAKATVSVNCYSRICHRLRILYMASRIGKGRRVKGEGRESC
jgi:hypothetical protein